MSTFSGFRPLRATKRVAVVIVVGVFGLASLVFASETAALQFLKIGAGVRSLGMGGTGVAFSHDSSSPYWNPAGLGALDRFDLSLSHARWLDNFQYQAFGYAQPLTRRLASGVNVYSFSRSDIQGYDDGGAASTAFDVSSFAGSLTFAGDISPLIKARPNKAALGLSFKYLRDDLDVKQASGFAMDFGLHGVPYRRSGPWFLDQIEFGASVSNLGSALTYEKEESDLPRIYRAGLAARGWAKSLLVAVDYEKPVDDPGSVRSGLEYQVFQILALRAGYRWALKDNLRTLQQGYHAGVGFRLGQVSIDYAYVPFQKLNDTHFLGLRWNFGSAVRLEQVEQRMNEHLDAAQRAFSRKDYARAEKELNYVLVVDPSHEAALRLQMENKKQLASLRADRLMALGKNKLAASDYGTAREYFQTVLTLSPNNQEASLLLIETDGYIAGLKKQRRDALTKQGEEFFKQNNFQDAIDIWEKVLLLDPGNQEIKSSLASAHQKLEEQKQRAAASDENERLEKGWLALNQKKAEKAKEIAQEVLKLYPSSQGAQTLLTQANSRLSDARVVEARYFLRKGTLREAFVALKDARALDPNNRITEDLLEKTRADIVKTGREEALNLYSQQKYKEALDRLNYLLDVDPKATDLTGYRDETRKRLTEINQAEAERLNREGLKAYDQGNMKEAIKIWKKVLDINPDHSNARRNLERAQQQIKE